MAKHLTVLAKARLVLEMPSLGSIAFPSRYAARSGSPLSYTLVFTRPANSVRLLRAPLWAATKSGVTHPAWHAMGLDTAGKVIAADGEALLGSYTTVAEKWFELKPAAGNLVSALRIISDFRNEAGKPFAGFQAALIQELQLLYG